MRPFAGHPGTAKPIFSSATFLLENFLRRPSRGLSPLWRRFRIQHPCGPDWPPHSDDFVSARRWICRPRLKLTPRSAGFLGDLSRVQGNSSEAQAWFEKVPEISPGDLSAARELGLVCLSAGRLSKPARFFNAWSRHFRMTQSRQSGGVNRVSPRRPPKKPAFMISSLLGRLYILFLRAACGRPHGPAPQEARLTYLFPRWTAGDTHRGAWARS